VTNHSKAAGCSCSSANHGIMLCPLVNGHLPTTHLATVVSSVSQKSPPLRFSAFFPKRLGIFNLFLHTYYTIISTLDYKRDHIAKFYISLEL